MKIKKYRFPFCGFILFKVIANLKSETSRNYLSYLWWIAEPMLQMIMFYVVFGLLLKRGTENFVVFLMTGLIPWLWFSKSLNQGMNSIQQGKGLMMQVHIPKIIFPTISIIQNTIKQIVVMVLLLVFLICLGIQPNIYWISIPFLFLTEFLMITCCTYSIALLVPFIPDIRVVVPFCLQALMFGSGVFYSLDMISKEKQELFYILNPMASLLANFRNVLVYNRSPEWTTLIVISVISLIVSFLLWLIARKFDLVYPRVV
jgi:homopolymeric O-antigen transport system permease protein